MWHELRRAVALSRSRLGMLIAATACCARTRPGAIDALGGREVEPSWSTMALGQANSNRLEPLVENFIGLA